MIATAANYASANVGTYTGNVVTYTLHDGTGGGLASNYSLANGTASGAIVQASTFVGASSTNNPSGYKASVSFLATLPADATGNVLFSSTNGAFSTNSLSGGTTTSLSITNLPRGTNVITVAYLGDGNYVGSTNSLNQIVTDHSPVASVMTVTRTAGLALIIALSDVATNWSDVDGDLVALTRVTMQSTNGVNLLALNWTTNTRVTTPLAVSRVPLTRRMTWVLVWARAPWLAEQSAVWVDTAEFIALPCSRSSRNGSSRC